MGYSLTLPLDVVTAQFDLISVGLAVIGVGVLIYGFRLVSAIARGRAPR